MLTVEKFYGILSIFCGAAALTSFCLFSDEFEIGVLWSLSCAVCFYMRLVFKNQRSLDE